METKSMFEGVDFVESTMNSYFAKDYKFGALNTEPHQAYTPFPGKEDPKIEEAIPAEMKKPGITLKDTPVKVYNGR